MHRYVCTLASVAIRCLNSPFSHPFSIQYSVGEGEGEGGGGKGEGEGAGERGRGGKGDGQLTQCMPSGCGWPAPWRSR